MELRGLSQTSILQCLRVCNMLNTRIFLMPLDPGISFGEWISFLMREPMSLQERKLPSSSHGYIGEICL